MRVIVLADPDPYNVVEIHEDHVRLIGEHGTEMVHESEFSQPKVIDNSRGRSVGFPLVGLCLVGGVVAVWQYLVSNISLWILVASLLAVWCVSVALLYATCAAKRFAGTRTVTFGGWSVTVPVEEVDELKQAVRRRG